MKDGLLSGMVQDHRRNAADNSIEEWKLKPEERSQPEEEDVIRSYFLYFNVLLQMLHAINCRYYTDPSGTFWQCNAKAIGSGSEGADSSLQEQYNKDLSLLEAETIALSILKQVMEEKVTPNNVDIAKVAPTYHLYTPAEVKDVISRL
ncbi:proteasome subunit alpha type-5-like [Zingiber officinale]|uniref:proteasome subunit alpha type-5-like n=1 Tax=Zingiber officinale TaxID=94328 RepID=UPI001C4D56B8|nr:proteasome subunit alpha type-5-like [Zingiber officinale]